MRRRVLSLIVAGGSLFFLVPICIVQVAYRHDIVALSTVKDVPVAVVLGASVSSGQPSQILQDRLDVAYDLYQAHRIQKIIVSGDDRSIDYNEPTVMKNYLADKGVKSDDIVTDFAGRRTYDSCYRAKEIFDQNRVVVVTQQFHLPRALYLCNALGLQAIGVSADRHTYDDLPYLIVREIVGSWRAWWDITVRHPLPVMGGKEKVF